jgi:hypothetical protein
MSIYDNEISNDPTSPFYAPYRYALLYPSPDVQARLNEKAEKVMADKQLEANRIRAKLIEQDRVSTGESTLINDVIAHEKFVVGSLVKSEPLDMDVCWK